MPAMLAWSCEDLARQAYYCTYMPWMPPAVAQTSPVVNDATSLLTIDYGFGSMPEISEDTQSSLTAGPCD